MIQSPTLAFLTLALGLLGILVELLRPGWVVPGLLGLLGIVIALHSIEKYPLRTSGVELLCASLLLLAGDYVWNSRSIGGGLATGALAYGSCHLFAPPFGINPALAVPVAVLFGAVTAFLANRAKQARVNKTTDL